MILFHRLALLAIAGLVPLPAAAHIHLHPDRAQPGEVLDIGLIVGHGCAGAATTGLRVAIPEGLEAAVPVPKDGWQVSAAEGEVGWQGGSLPDGTKASFTLRATVAAGAPGAIAIPVIQICGDRETRWIGTADADSPAPVLTVQPAR
ncbi:DUF1775 domain-containing protein [Paenirhodobacter populi]|uniref:DUF1775 domain-containing protein n=1 Tax=Paenirhodobacter populi TaxID=2306993 RepID=UPI000FE2D8EC|nr:DUF1775 domain-containing protein [Sinirhodobacter populi]RWR08816.1 DUF1775 domain-containing protein [Sinirhodobacter populi]